MSPMPTKHECELLKLQNTINTLEGTLENTQDDNVEKEGQIATLEAELEKLKKFAQEVIKAECWDVPMDGFDIQTLAEELGLIEPYTATEDDVDEESDFEVGDSILRFTEVLSND